MSQPESPRRRVKKVEPKATPSPGVDLYDKKAAEAESKERAAELAKVAKIKAEREKREKIEAECKRLQIPRLLAIKLCLFLQLTWSKGVRRLRPVVVQCEAASLSRRDHFLLETETHLFHYKGEFAPFTSQRTRAVERAQEALQKERMVPLKLVSVKPDDSKEQLFWSTLKGDKSALGEGLGDNVWELKYNQAFKLYRYDAEIGLMPEDEVSCNKLDKKSIFVVAAPGELYVWYGKETGLLRRNHARSQAVTMYKAKPEGEPVNPNAWVQIREIHQGSEDYVFRQKFPDWIEMSATGVPLDPQVLLEIFSRKMLDFNPAKVAQIEDVDGSLDIWVAKDHGKVPISKISYGEFFNGNSYIVLYQSVQGRVVYFWQGSQSHVSWDHAAESIKAVQKIALQSVDLLRRKKTTIPVVRVAEGDEPPHLLALFNGAFIVRSGKFDSFDRRLLLMYHIRGGDPYSCRVTECALSRKALRSEDAFIAYSPKTMFVWRGKQCNDFAFKVAKALSERFVAMDTVKVKEGSEEQAFWDMLGGKVEMKEMEKKRVKGRKCHKCAHGNPIDCRFCRKCGAPMGEKKSAAAAAATTATTPSATPGDSPAANVDLAAVTGGASAAVAAKVEDLSSLVGGEALAKKSVLDVLSSGLPGRRSRRNSSRSKGKPIKVCPQCNKSNPLSNRYCRGCGYEMTNVKESSDVSQSEGESGGEVKLRRASTRVKASPAAALPSPVPGGVPCKSCCKNNLPGTKFCKFCGTPLAAEAAPVAASAPASSENTAPPAVAPEAVAPVAAVAANAVPQILCAQCGTSNDLTDKFCSSCAEPLKSAAVVVAPVAVPAVVVAEIKCPACATVNEVGCKFCLDCGENLQSVQPGPAAAAVSTPPSSASPPPALSVVAEAPVTEVQCKVCSTWNEAGCKFCADCGETLVSTAAATVAASAPVTSSPSLSKPNRAGSVLKGRPEAPEKTEASADAIKCPKCRRPNAAGQKFCRKCGWELAKARSKGSRTSSAESSSGEAAAKKEPTHDCRQCGVANPLDTVFCKKCGTRFSEAKARNPADEIARLRRANSSYAVVPQVSKSLAKDRGVRCADPACAKPNKPGDAECRVCGKPLPAEQPETPEKQQQQSPSKPGASVGKIVIPAAISPATQAPAGPPGGESSKRLLTLKRAAPERVDSSAFLKKKDKGALEDQVGDWLKRRDESSTVPKLGAASPAAAASPGNGTPGKLSIIQAKMRAMEEKAAAEKAKTEEERKKKEEEAAALEARRWVKPKLFIIQDNAIRAKRSILQVHVQNPETQVVIDAKDVVWVWCGSKTHPDQAKFAKDLAKFYCDVVLKESNRKAVIKEAKESDPDFVKLFQGWDYEEDAPQRHMHHSVSVPALAQPPAQPAAVRPIALSEGSEPAADSAAIVVDPAAVPVPAPYNAIAGAAAAPVVADVASAAAVAPIAVAPAAVAPSASASVDVTALPRQGTTQQVLGMYMCYFPLERLQDPSSLPPTLNMGSLETYLTEEDFKHIFRMTKEEFAQLPAWKKVSLKKKQGLF